MDWTYFETTLLPLVVATILGGLMGLERELAGHWAGLRTHMLVSLGAAIFMILGTAATEAAPAELSRIIQGVATGVGFIGAGTILKLAAKERIRGLTTASSIWAAAAIGVGVGLRMYPLAITATVLAFLILRIANLIEGKMGTPKKPQDDSPEDDN